MNRQVEYLRDMLDRMSRISEYTAGGHDAFVKDRFVQDAVLRNLEIIGEIARGRLDEAVMNLEPAIPWRAVADFRNFLIHEYDKVTVEEIWSTIVTDLPPLRAAVHRMIARLENEPDESRG